MRFPRFFLLIAILLTAISGPARAFDHPQTYLSPQMLPPQLLPPPPREGGKNWRAQEDAVIKAQRDISQADIAAMRNEQNLRLDLLTAEIGPAFTRDRLPKTFALLDRVWADAGQVVEADKQFWHTKRPYLTDKHVKLYVDPIDSSPAYPSGHTAESRVMAEVLGMLVPQKLAALRVRAETIAQHRVGAGVHYPVDLEGGRYLAGIIVGALLANDDFCDDLAAARKELAAVR
ncbi:MAG: phosphatase PAP2 family protein [Alphaproteobacteria bacterium]|nr:phosphatase PAP2 family protein [Alphaproteobacteria bacterium]